MLSQTVPSLELDIVLKGASLWYLRFVKQTFPRDITTLDSGPPKACMLSGTWDSLPMISHWDGIDMDISVRAAPGHLWLPPFKWKSWPWPVKLESMDGLSPDSYMGSWVLRSFLWKLAWCNAHLRFFWWLFLYQDKKATYVLYKM